MMLIVLVCSGCTDPVREMKSYKPPALYDAMLAHPKTSEKSKEDSDFQAQKQKLDDMQKEWEKYSGKPQS
ncbi:MAG: hypothetical protein HC887_09615 [Desulfobacteraceae bacterium]|nr:hypothetical protein [Desulfobacteraceae bacterium]